MAKRISRKRWLIYKLGNLRAKARSYYGDLIATIVFALFWVVLGHGIFANFFATLAGWAVFANLGQALEFSLRVSSIALATSCVGLLLTALKLEVKSVDYVITGIFSGLAMTGLFIVFGAVFALIPGLSRTFISVNTATLLFTVPCIFASFLSIWPRARR